MRHPRFRQGQSVRLASHCRTIPAYSGKPQVGHDTALTVAGIRGKGTDRDPWSLTVRNAEGNTWILQPGDVVDSADA